MSRTITVELPEEVYESLAEWSQKKGGTPERLAADYLTATVQAKAQDPLLKWAGAFTAGVADVADRHDEYIGQALMKKLRGNQNE